MEFKNILLKKKVGLATIVINRPRVRNALDVATRKELLVALDDVENDQNIRVVIFTGAGDEAFVAGADVSLFETFSAPGYLDFNYSLGGMGLYRRIENMDKPTIAAINGYALGGGCELTMVCDIRIASENAKFGQTEINLGLMPACGGTQRLSRLVGVGRTKELCFTGDMIDAKEAERIGLVNRVVPPEQLEATVRELALKIASKSPLVLKYIKRSINRSQRTELDSGLAFEAQCLSTLFGSEDTKEGIRAFLEKRKPRFSGK